MADSPPMYLPVIEKDDFPAFRKLMSRNFQNTYRNYANWTAQHHAWAAMDPDYQPTVIMVRSADFANDQDFQVGEAGLAALLDYVKRVGEIS